jgi:hypothetical protein
MAAFIKFNAVAANPWLAKYNLGSDTVKAILTNTAPAAANAVYTDVSGGELATANGYTVGGASLTLTSASQTAGLFKYIASAANPTWSATGAVGPFRYVIIYDFTATNKDLLGAWDYGSSITMGNGDTFTLALDATNGVLQMS